MLELWDSVFERLNVVNSVRLGWKSRVTVDAEIIETVAKLNFKKDDVDGRCRLVAS